MQKLKDENETLKMATDKSKQSEVKSIKEERDKYKRQCQEMEQFLADYGLKWIGNDGTAPGEKQGNFNADAVNKELEHKNP